MDVSRFALRQLTTTRHTPLFPAYPTSMTPIASTKNAFARPNLMHSGGKAITWWPPLSRHLWSRFRLLARDYIGFVHYEIPASIGRKKEMIAVGAEPRVTVERR
jgi:hypothetical protein